MQAVLQLREAETIIENHKSLQLRFASLQQDYETNMQLLQASQQQVVELTNSLEEFQYVYNLTSHLLNLLTAL